MKRTILIVDDDEDVRILIGIAVRKLGYDRVSATNGEEALRIIESATIPIDAIITDIQMPVMDGVKFVRRLRDSAVTKPVIFMSGGLGGYSVEDLRELSPYFLEKPHEMKKLDEILSSVLTAGESIGPTTCGNTS